MANETTWRLNFENEDMNAVFESLIDKIEQTDKELRDLEKTQKETFESTTQGAKKANEQLGVQGKNLDLNKVRFKNLKEEAQNAFENISQKGGDATSALSKLGRTGGIVGTVVAGVGVAIVAAFLDVEKNAKKAKRELEGIKAVGEELKNRTFAGLRGVVQAALGNFGAAAVEFETAVNNIAEDTRKAREEGKKLFDIQDGISAKSRELIKAEAARAVELQKVQALAADENKTTAERIELIKNASSLEREINGIRIAGLNNQLELIRAENAVYGEQEGSLEEIAAIEAELIELRGSNQVIVIQSQQEINALLQEEAELRQKIISQIQDANAIFTDQEAERSLQKQIDSFKELRESINAAGLAEEYSEELANLDEVIAGLGKRLTDGLIDPISEQLPTLLTESLQVSSQTAELLSDELEAGYKQAIENLQKKGFKDITEDQKRFIEDQFKDAFSSVADIVVQSTLTQIDRQEQVVDAREDNISALESQLAEQERLEAQGLANQSSRLRQSLQEERTILKREQDKRIDLEKKAARQRLIANSLQQGSEITLAASKLLNQGASGFIPGIIAAAGGIALLFRIIAQAKANAAAFATPPKFREGTNYLVGPSHEGGGITIEAEGGERILSKALNERLGGSQLTNDELANFALMGMNAEQAIAPMAAAIASGAASSRKVEDFKAWERNEIIADVFKAEIRGMKKELIDTMRERPTYYRTDRPGRREYYKGKTKVVEKIIPNN